MKRPAGVTILGILCIVFAAFTGWSSLFFFRGGPALAQMAGPARGLDPAMLARIAPVLGGIVFIFAMLYVAVGVGLLKLHNWARILAMVLLVLGLLSSLAGIANSLARMHPLLLVREVAVVVLDLLILWYLLRPHVREAFGASAR
ncbi:MAG TPA: hypothetical protein VKE24_03275 [Candidatus Acidoferrales bacterium]|nr:hypothetical protein [Candidatus Acidoferrales bacterium]